MASHGDKKSARDDENARADQRAREADELHSLIPDGEAAETSLDDEPIDFVALAALSQPGARGTPPPPPPPQATARGGTLRPHAAPPPVAGTTLQPPAPALAQPSAHPVMPPPPKTGGTLRPPAPALSQPAAARLPPAPAVPSPAVGVAAGPRNFTPASSQASAEVAASEALPFVAPPAPLAEPAPRLAERSAWSDQPGDDLEPTYLRSRASHKRWLLGLLVGFALGVPVGAWVFGGSAAPPPAKLPVFAAAQKLAASTAVEVAQAPSRAPLPTAEPSPAPVEARVVAPAAPQPTAAQEPAPAPSATPQPTAAPEPAAPAVALVAPTPAPRNAVPTQALAPRLPAPSARPPAAVAAWRESAQPPREQPVVRVQPQPTASEVPVLAVKPAAPPPPTAAPEPVAPAAAAPAKSRVDTLLDDALANPADKAVQARKQEAAVVALQAELPDAPSREDVGSAMTVLLPAIRGCAMGQSGLATAVIVARNDGRVASVSVTGAPFENSASGRCMEGVVRRAHFPRFKQPSFRVQFPFAIQ